MTFKIDDDVPVPIGRPTKNGPITATLRALGVGQSFFSDGVNTRTLGGYVHPLRKEGRKFASRTVTERHPDTGEPVNGVRIWRIE